MIPEFRNPLLRELIEDDFRLMYERFPGRIENFTVIHGRVNFDPDRDLS